jgi:hypothetical protein
MEKYCIFFEVGTEFLNIILDNITLCFCLQSYMEDHLKNKDRLEQEWVALCAYEAEPCAASIAQKVSQIHIY